VTRRLLLFDVDGTLLSCGSQVRGWIEQALTAAFGRDVPVDGYAFAGKTDDRIFRELAVRAGLAEDAVERGLPEARRRYLEALEGGLRAEEMILLPGVLPLLEALAVRSEIALGLLTGNWEPGARSRLARFDLNRFFEFGAFSEGQTHRPALVPIALERAHSAVGHVFSARDTWIIGDSILDVECAREHGIRCLAVATGQATVEELSAAGADQVCHNLGSYEALLAQTWAP